MNPTQKAAAIALFKVGKGAQEIATFLGLSYDTVWAFLQFGALLEGQRQGLDVTGSTGSGTGVGGSAIALQTNGVPNTIQNVLNLKNGTGIIIVSDAFGGVTINSTGGGSGNLSGTLTSGIIPFATGVNTLSDGSLTDDGAGDIGIVSPITTGLNLFIGTGQGGFSLTVSDSPGTIVLQNGSGETLTLGNDTALATSLFRILGPTLTHGLVTLGENSIFTGKLTFAGSTSGNASISVADAAGTPNTLLFPTSTGIAGQLMSTDGGNPQQLSWLTFQLPITKTAIASNFFTSYDSTTGLFTSAQPAFTDISGVAVSGQIPGLDASKITTGLLALARGGTNADLSATGGASFVLRQSSSGAAITVSQLAYTDLTGSPQLPVTKAAIASNWLNSYSSVTGLFTATQPAYTDLTGTPQLAVTKAAVTSNFFTSYSSVTGLFTAAQPAFTDISGTATPAQIPNLDASKITTGLLALSRGGTNADLSGTGGTSFVLRQSSVGAAITVSQLAYSDISGTPQLAVTKAAVTSNFFTSYSSVTGLFTAAQPAFTDISGVATSAQIPNLDASKITTGLLALARGGTNADLSATGGTSFVLRQSTTGAAITVSQLAYSDISGTPTVNTWAGLTGVLSNGQVIPWTDAGISRLGADSLAIGNGTNGDATATVGLATLNVSAAVKLNSGNVIMFNADSGISRLGAASLAIGNGTAADFSGTLKLTILNAVTGIQINGAATTGQVLRGNGTNFVSAQLNFTDLAGTVSATQGGLFVLLTPAADQVITHNLTIGLATSGFAIGAVAGVLRIDSGGAVGQEFRPLNAANNNAGMIVSNLNATTSFLANGTAGVTAGNFTAVTSITTKQGLVTVLSGTSDARLKIADPYEGGLDVILAITPVRYRWNEKGQAQTGLSGEQDFVGFIAQDVQRSIPEAITATEPSKTEPETYLSLDDRPIIAALVNAVKQLTARIVELEKHEL